MKAVLLVTLLALGSASAWPVVISEFLASNNGSVQDGDGLQNDWIELHNPSITPVNLLGWRLRDALEEWVFPSVTIEAGSHLVVFASGQNNPNYLDSGGFLHTTFRLAAAGENLSLIRPDGTVASEYLTVPPQREDISFGNSPDRQILVGPQSDARFLVSEIAIPNNWRGGAVFDDSDWSQGAAALGFGIQSPENITTSFQIGTGVIGNQTFGGSLGLDFIVIEPILITELGVFDSGSDGFTGTLTTQIWRRNDGGTPNEPSDDFGIEALTGLNFTASSPGQLIAGSRFKSLAEPLLLSPGSYSVISSGFNTADPNGNLGTANAGDWETDDANGAIQFTGRGRFGSAGTFPPNPDGGPANRYAAGTFRLLPLADSEVQTDIGIAMRGVSNTVRERIAFQVNDPAVIDSLIFQIKFNDGFTAWINGEEIVTQNVPPNQAMREDLSFTIPLASSLLVAGTNILAIEARNLTANDPDFLLQPSLFSTTSSTASPRYFDQPSPGAPNRQAGYTDFVADTKFSHDRGFYTEPFSLTITTETPVAEIIYTTDGSPPSLANGTTYSAPITISGTTVLRARAFREGFRPTDIDTQSYLFPAEIAVQNKTPSGYPQNWNGTSSRYGMTDASANYARAAGNAAFSPSEAESAIIASLEALPTLSIVTDIDDLFDPNTGIYVNPRARGQAWERPVSVELIYPDGTPGFQENAGMRMMGFSSRNIEIRKLHMRLLFKDQYGAGTLRFPFFGDDRSDRINTIALRGNRRDAFIHTNNATYLGDEWAKRTQSEMGQLAPRGNFVHLYLNGLYWGVYNPTERPDDAFAENYLGGEREDYDVVKFCCPDRAVAGDLNAWNQLLSEARGGIDTVADYQRVQGNVPDGLPNPTTPPLLDVDSLIDYLIAGQYHGAWDWPGNYYAFRDRKADRTTGYRFFTWDNDVIFDGGNPSIANKVTPDPGHPWWTESPGEIDLGIRNHPEYRIRFADRVYQHYFHGGALSEEANLARWNDLAAQVRPALFAESARWGDANSTLRTVQDHWDPMNNRMLTQYFPARQAIVFDQLRNSGLYPSIDPPELNQQGGNVPLGFPLAFTRGETIYYTLNGSDPRLPGGSINPAAKSATSGSAPVTLIPANAPTRALIPADDSNGLAWITSTFDDSSWQTGSGGVGYDSGGDYAPVIGLDVFNTMRGNNETAYIRIPFAGANPADFTSLTLRMRFDDGFVAYLNGTQIASINEPLNPAWNSGAIRAAEASITEFIDFDISPFISLLQPSGNVLAIHGMNRGVTSADFLIQAVLEGESLAGEVAEMLTQTVAVNSRVLKAGEWSALNQASFIVGTPASSANLIISEIFYNPPGADESGEFIELFNRSAGTIDLSGVTFVAGISYEFPLNTLLPAGGRLVLGASQYEGRLSNEGEELTLLAADGSTIVTLNYDDRFPWPAAADGDGFSLVFFATDPSSPFSWRSSVSPGGTPGSDDALPFTGGDLLAYALPNPDLRFLSSGAAWSLEFTRPLAADEARFLIELSTDLQNWEVAGSPTSITAPDPEGKVRETVGGLFTERPPKIFARVKVVLQTP